MKRKDDMIDDDDDDDEMKRLGSELRSAGHVRTVSVALMSGWARPPLWRRMGSSPRQYAGGSGSCRLLTHA